MESLKDRKGSGPPADSHRVNSPAPELVEWSHIEMDYLYLQYTKNDMGPNCYGLKWMSEIESQRTADQSG